MTATKNSRCLPSRLSFPRDYGRRSRATKLSSITLSRTWTKAWPPSWEIMSMNSIRLTTFSSSAKRRKSSSWLIRLQRDWAINKPLTRKCSAYYTKTTSWWSRLSLTLSWCKNWSLKCKPWLPNWFKRKKNAFFTTIPRMPALRNETYLRWYWVACRPKMTSWEQSTLS